MPDDHPLVGVVVLNYRGAEDTIRCLRSLEAVLPRPLVVVVDNASGDGSSERIAAAAPDVELIVNDVNVGFGGGCNTGIAALRRHGVEHVWLLNNDTTVEAATLRQMLDVAASDERIGAVGSVIYDMDASEQVLTWGGGRVGRRTGFTRDARSDADRLDYLTGASLLLRVRALDEVGAFDPRFFFTWEDVDLGIRLRAAGWRVAVAEGSRVWHRGGGSLSAVSPVRMEHHAAGVVLFMRKHSPAPALTTLPMLGWYVRLALRRRDPAVIAGAWRGWRDGWRRSRPA
jgi:GT2 family glycosyltransferase